ncbi:MAG: alpha/beta fold hydrolase [Acidimicrobiales bacterium]
MPSARANGITIEYETFGDVSAPPVLLIMGLGGQLILWDERFVAKLAARGLFVIRYDNRDVGKSTSFDEAGPPDLLAALAGAASAPYLLDDMAADAAGLLDALGIEAAHIVGTSMGGMIAQAFAIRYPARTISLTSIMSTTGDRSVGQPRPEAMAMLMTPVPPDRQTAIENAVATWKVIGSPGFQFDEVGVRERAAEAYDRGFHPSGTGRQMVAVLSSPDRTPGLGQLTMPTLVIHGEDDPLVDVSGGRATAAAIPGARLKLIPGMGHDLPPALFDELVDDLASHTIGAHA